MTQYGDPNDPRLPKTSPLFTEPDSVPPQTNVVHVGQQWHHQTAAPLQRPSQQPQYVQQVGPTVPIMPVAPVAPIAQSDEQKVEAFAAKINARLAELDDLKSIHLALAGLIAERDHIDKKIDTILRELVGARPTERSQSPAATPAPTEPIEGYYAPPAPPQEPAQPASLHAEWQQFPQQPITEPKPPVDESQIAISALAQCGLHSNTVNALYGARITSVAELKDRMPEIAAGQVDGISVGRIKQINAAIIRWDAEKK